jgi:hypothetical protein
MKPIVETVGKLRAALDKVFSTVEMEGSDEL